MLKNAPMFKNIAQKGKGVGLGRGKATVLRAQAQKGRGMSFVDFRLLPY
jgi:small nuclear ribonucleoprotein D3